MFLARIPLHFGLLLGLVPGFVFSSLAHAALQLPQGLTTADRKEALKIVGFGTAAKVLTDPYALGGFHGFEFGVSIETIPTEDLGRLGNRLSSVQPDVTVPKFTIGKGLYSNLDIFIHFIPYNQTTELSQYGGAIRWGVYEAPSLPLSLSLLAHINTGNINNQLSTRTFGIDAVGGINVEEVSLYAGIGGLQSSGTFVGGNSGVTDTLNKEYESVSGLHTLIGANVRIKQFFAAVQLDRYTQSVISAKLGLRL